MDLTAVLRRAVAAGASDVHFKVGQPPVLRSDGELAPSAEFPALGDADLQSVLDRITAAVPRRRQSFDETGDVDLAYSRSTTIANSALIHASSFPIDFMVGMPAATQTAISINPAQGSYAGQSV